MAMLCIQKCILTSSGSFTSKPFGLEEREALKCFCMVTANIHYMYHDDDDVLLF